MVVVVSRAERDGFTVQSPALRCFWRVQRARKWGGKPCAEVCGFPLERSGAH